MSHTKANEAIERLHNTFIQKIACGGEYEFNEPKMEFGYSTVLGYEHVNLLPLIETGLRNKGYDVSVENIANDPNRGFIIVRRNLTPADIQGIKGEWLMSSINNSEIDTETAEKILSTVSHLVDNGIPKQEILLHLRMIRYGKYYNGY